MAEWGVLLNGVYLSGGNALQWSTLISTPACSGLAQDRVAGAAGCLTAPPDGLGLPAKRTEDTTYAQRDGIRMFNDYSENRIITLETVTVCADGCPGCNPANGKGARQHVRDISGAWSESCGDDNGLSELVIFTDCHEFSDDLDVDGFGEGGFGDGPFGDPDFTTPNRTLNGPFGIVGRPRVAEVKWIGQGSKCAEVTLRFDGVDQNIYVLDECGTPGYTNSVDIQPGAEIRSRCYPRCYPLCYTIAASGAGSVPATSITVAGTQCISPTITLWPQLTRPRIENLTTGDFIAYGATIVGYPVVINAGDMTAYQNGQSVTHLLSGSLSFGMTPGDYDLRLLSRGGDADNGYATVEWRDTVVQI